MGSCARFDVGCERFTLNCVRFVVGCSRFSLDCARFDVGCTSRLCSRLCKVVRIVRGA